PPREDDRDTLVAEATQKALERFDEILREMALQRYQAFEGELGPLLTRFAIGDTVRRIRVRDEAQQLDELTRTLAPEFGPWLAKHPALEDLTRLTRAVANHLKASGALDDPVAALSIQASLPRQVLQQTSAFVGLEQKTFAGEVLEAVSAQRTALWRE